MYIALFCINANYTAKTSTCTTGNICTYCYCAVAEAVGKAAIICANQTTCNGTGTACDNAACAFNIVNSAAAVINTNNAAYIACIAIISRNGYSVAKSYNAFNASVVLPCNSTGSCCTGKCAAVNVNVFNSTGICSSCTVIIIYSIRSNGAENACIIAANIQTDNAVAAAVKGAGKTNITSSTNGNIIFYITSVNIVH